MIEETARNYALKHHAPLGRYGPGHGEKAGYYYLASHSGHHYAISATPTAQSAIRMMMENGFHAPADAPQPDTFTGTLLDTDGQTLVDFILFCKYKGIAPTHDHFNWFTYRRSINDRICRLSTNGKAI